MSEFLKRLLFVRKCLSCGQPLAESREQVFCPKCRLEYDKLKRRICRACLKKQSECQCLPIKLSEHIAWSAHLIAFDDPLSKLILYTLKRRNYAPLQDFLATELVLAIKQTGIDFKNYDITYAPRKPKSVREYGFDQSLILAETMADMLALSVVELFAHTHRSELQKNLNAIQRTENAEKSYKLHKHCVREHDNLIIVDDVITTGSTMAKLVSLAKEIGYQNIAVVCVARTVHEKEIL